MTKKTDPEQEQQEQAATDTQENEAATEQPTPEVIPDGQVKCVACGVYYHTADNSCPNCGQSVR